MGPDASARLRREATALDRFADLLPVPPLLGSQGNSLVLGWVEGVPGQELLPGRPEAVLHEVGALARRLAEVDPSVLGLGPPGAVLVHGDFGPQNLLLTDSPSDEVRTAALLDWEWLHLGEPDEDLAWAEWIVRHHHGELSWALPSLFAGYGATPPWSRRHTLMLNRCAELTAFVDGWGGPSSPAALDWRRRCALTAAFVD